MDTPGLEGVAALRNRLLLRLTGTAVLGGPVVAYLVASAMGLDGDAALASILRVFLPIAVASVVFHGAVAHREVRRALAAGPELRLARLLELPRRLETLPYVCAWVAGGLAYAAITRRVYGGEAREVVGAAAGLFAALFTGPLLCALLEDAVRPVALAEARRTPGARRGTSAFLNPRQRWFLPYTFLVAVASLMFFAGLAARTSSERAIRLALDAIALYGGDAVREVVRPEVEGAHLAGLAPMAVAVLFIGAAFLATGVVLSRRQERAAAEVERSLRGLADGAPAAPDWIAVDEMGDLAASAARISAEMAEVYARLQAMAAGDLSQELAGDSGLVQAFRGSQAALRGLAERLEALGRGEAAEGGALPGALGASFEAMLTAFRSTVVHAQTIAAGDLRRDVPSPGALGSALQRMTEHLRGIVGRTQAVSGEISGIVVHLRTASAQLSTATTEQVAAATETANTMTEMAQTSAVSADRAQALIRRGEAASAVVGEGVAAAEGSSGASREIAGALEAIGKASAALADRVRRIDGVTEKVEFLADQTTTLAVNAGIEAARAGDAGRGFGVVAREMRSLAGDSRAAAREIRDLLGEIRARMGQVDGAVAAGGEKVELEGRQVARLAEVIAQLGETVEEAVGLMRQVEGSARQHQAGVGQVAQALASLRQSSEGIRDGAKLLGELSGKAADLAAALQGAAGAYALPGA